jgi:hypothetical protein
MGRAEAILEREFLDTAINWSRLRDPEKANKEYEKLFQMKSQFRQLPDRGEAALKRIAGSNNLNVQILAAAALLALDEPFASELLEQIQDGNLGAASFEAKMMLQEWKKGALKEYWK